MKPTKKKRRVVHFIQQMKAYTECDRYIANVVSSSYAKGVNCERCLRALKARENERKSK